MKNKIVVFIIGLIFFKSHITLSNDDKDETNDFEQWQDKDSLDEIKKNWSLQSKLDEIDIEALLKDLPEENENDELFKKAKKNKKKEKSKMYDDVYKINVQLEHETCHALYCKAVVDLENKKSIDWVLPEFDKLEHSLLDIYNINCFCFENLHKMLPKKCEKCSIEIKEKDNKTEVKSRLVSCVEKVTTRDGKTDQIINTEIYRPKYLEIDTDDKNIEERQLTGYYALRNGLAIADFYKNDQKLERKAIVKYLADKDNKIETYLENWKKFITGRNILKNFMRDALLSAMKDVVLSDCKPQGISYLSKKDRKWISFKRSEFNLENDTQISIAKSLKTIVNKIVRTLDDSSAHSPCIITNAQIAKLICQELKSLHSHDDIETCKLCNTYFNSFQNRFFEFNRNFFLYNEFDDNGKIVAIKKLDASKFTDDSNFFQNNIDPVSKNDMLDLLDYTARENYFDSECVVLSARSDLDIEKHEKFLKALENFNSQKTAIVTFLIKDGKNWSTVSIKNEIDNNFKVCIVDPLNRDFTQNLAITNLIEYIKQKFIRPSFLAQFIFLQPKMSLDDYMIDDIPKKILTTVRALNSANFCRRTKQIIQPLLLYGSPGTGKSTLAYIIAKLTKRKIVTVAGSDLLDKYYGGTTEKIHKLFEDARNSDHSVIVFIDEIETIVNVDKEFGRLDACKTLNLELSKLIMDNMNCNYNVFCIAAANNIQDLNKSTKSRFNCVEIKMPNQETRLKLINKICSSKGIILSDKTARWLAKDSAGWSIRDLEMGINNSGNFALQENCNEINEQHLKNGFKITARKRKKDLSLENRKALNETLKNKFGNAILDAFVRDIVHRVTGLGLDYFVSNIFGK